MSATLYCGDARDVLATLPERSAQTCVTSPPYWGLRDYGEPGQLGLEHTPAEYVANMVEVFRGVWRVLRDDGVVFLNLGDSYASGGTGRRDTSGEYAERRAAQFGSGRGNGNGPREYAQRAVPPGLKPKDLVGIPWMTAFALRADGWYLRSDVIWAKPNPMPESVTDRPTKSHEYVFLLTKSERYYYDAAAIAEEAVCDRMRGPALHGDLISTNGNGGLARREMEPTRNARSVWNIPTQSYAGAHFATFPEELARRCILAGSKPGDVVLDCFGGSGTTAAVAVGHGRGALHIDLNPAYTELARQRIGPMLCEGVARKVNGSAMETVDGGVMPLYGEPLVGLEPTTAPVSDPGPLSIPPLVVPPGWPDCPAQDDGGASKNHPETSTQVQRAGPVQ